MPNATITTLVNQLALVTIDNTVQQSFQDDVIFELARGMYPGVRAQTTAAFIAATAGTAQYTLPTASPAFQRVPLVICYDDRQLAQVSRTEAWEYEEEWRRNPSAHVVGYLQDPEDRTVFSLVPPPRTDGAAIGTNTPTNVTTWPAGNITVIAASADTTFPSAVYADLILPIALEVLAREFARDSDHQDEVFAATCHTLASLFFGMFGPAIGAPPTTAGGGQEAA
jgi:hypothetical protein